MNVYKNGIAVILCLFICTTTYAQYDQDYDPYDKAESPYIEGFTADGTAIGVPVDQVNVSVHISGIIAEVTSRQTYINRSAETLSATYVFPGSTRAAVYGMKMEIGDRIVHAQITEKQEAQEAYQQAVEGGKTASLLQQHRPNVFQMDLGNIPPNIPMVIEIKYTELLSPDEGVYEFVYPTIIGSRYDKEIVSGEQWVNNPYANVDQEGTHAIHLPIYNIEVVLSAPLPLQGVNTSTHKTDIRYENKKKAVVKLDQNGLSEHKDFILKYRLKGDKIQTGMMLYEGEQENFFLYIGQGPKYHKPSSIPPREYFFIIDVSGSMKGFPLDVSKQLIKNLLEGLSPNDKFNILLFASASAVLSESSIAATPDNISRAIDFVNAKNGGSGTNLLQAVKRAYSMINDESSSSMVILTDGYVTVEKEAFDFIEQNLKRANFFPFGIGKSVNRHLIEGIAHFGQAEPFIVTSKQQAKTVAGKFKKYISSPLLTQINIDIEGLDVYDVSPAQQPDLFSEKPIIMYGKWRGMPRGEISLSGQSGSGPYLNTLKIAPRDVSGGHSGLKYLWARNKLQFLSDYQLSGFDAALKKEITALGLEYSLLTKYTSFLAIDNQNQTKPKNQPRINNSGAVPEPHEWALIIIGIGFLFFLYWKSINNTVEV